MTLSLENLQDKSIEELIKIIEEKNNIIKSTKIENEILRHKLQLYLHNKYAKQSEKNENPYQGRLFDEAEVGDAELKAEEAKETKVTVPSFERRKPSRKALPKDLPRVRNEYDLAEDEKKCDCGCELTKIGEDVSEQLEFIPAKVQVIQHVKFKYACKACEDTIKTAKPPKLPIPKSIASAGLLAHTIVSKYEDHRVPRIHLN